MTKVVAPKYNVLNTSPIRKGVPEKATGQAKYTADLSLPNMRVPKKSSFVRCKKKEF